MEESSRCQCCRRKVGVQAFALQCDLCNCWIHAKCGGFSTDLYKALKVCCPQLLKIYCPTCNTKAEGLKITSDGVSDDESPDVTCTQAPDLSAITPTNVLSSPPPHDESKGTRPTKLLYADIVADNLPADRNPLPMKGAKPSEGFKIRALEKRLEQLESKLDASKAQKITTNADKKPDRERCLILFNAPESQEESSSERILHDRSLLQSLVSKLFDPGENGLEIITAYRLGRRNTEVNKPRPLKLVLTSIEECNRVLSRVHRLKGDPIHIQRDLSPEEREKMKQALQELRHRREGGETDLRIVNFRVVRKPLRAFWRPLVIYPVVPEIQA